MLELSTTQGVSTTRATDPLGRITLYSYASNEIDLAEIRQVNGAATDLLWSATYNGNHRILTQTDNSSQTWTYTYNTQGQLLTITTPQRAGITENRTTTQVYDSNGYLQSVTAPATGDGREKQIAGEVPVGPQSDTRRNAQATCGR